MSRTSKNQNNPRCVGSLDFRPDELIQDLPRLRQAQEYLASNDLYNASRHLLRLPERDNYVYHAMASVTLGEAQHAINLGAANGLHGWYRNEDGSLREPPPLIDVEAYISIFDASTATVMALKNFGANAKKGSIRFESAAHIAEKRYLHPAVSSKLTVPKSKSLPSQNPFFDFWAWSCRTLEWCGPCSSSKQVASSHHALPIFMHHFGCATPSHESLEILRVLAQGRAIADIGSGNGYWAYLLRRYGLTVHPVDNMSSEWRVTWVGDTAVSDGVKWLQRHNHGRDLMLLLVYPVVGGGGEGGVRGGLDGDLTRRLIAVYKGDTVAVVGTQNSNGYTGFKSMTMDQFMEGQHKEWTRVVQIPLPSFAGKDEALFVFQRGDRAPQEEVEAGEKNG